MAAAEDAQESRIKADVQELHNSSAPASEDAGLTGGVTCSYVLMCRLNAFMGLACSLLIVFLIWIWR